MLSKLSPGCNFIFNRLIEWYPSSHLSHSNKINKRLLLLHDLKLKADILLSHYNHLRICSTLSLRDCHSFPPKGADYHFMWCFCKDGGAAQLELRKKPAPKWWTLNTQQHHSGWESTTRDCHSGSLSLSDVHTLVHAHTNTVASLDRFKTLTSTSHWIRILIEKTVTAPKSQYRLWDPSWADVL